MPKFNSTRKKPKTQTHLTQTQTQIGKSKRRRIKPEKGTSEPEQGVESEPEQVGDFTWKKNDNVKPEGMPGPGYTILEDKGDNWLMLGPDGRYHDLIPKKNENDGWEKITRTSARLSIADPEVGKAEIRKKRKRKKSKHKKRSRAVKKSKRRRR